MEEVIVPSGRGETAEKELMKGGETGKNCEEMEFMGLESGGRGQTEQHFGFISSVLKGSFSILLTFTADFTPSPCLVVYTIFPNGGVTADSIRFDVALCFQNQVRLTPKAEGELCHVSISLLILLSLFHASFCGVLLKVKVDFPTKESHTGSIVQLQLEAAPGSMCAVQAVDENMLLMRPENELTSQKVSATSQKVKAGVMYELREIGRDCGKGNWRLMDEGVFV